MRTTAKTTDLALGLVMIAAIVGLAALFLAASGGPGMLASQATVDVLFKDGQGVKPGQIVRVSGVDAGRVRAVDLVDHEGNLRVRVRIGLPADIAGRLRQDMRIGLQPSLTGQTSVNVMNPGTSAVAWVPGQFVEGVETSLFDPVLEQLGMSPADRDQLGKTLAQMRDVIQETGPRLGQALASLQKAAGHIEQATEEIRPHLKNGAASLEKVVPHVDSAVQQAAELLAQAEAVIAENRKAIAGTTTNLETLTGSAGTLVSDAAPKFVSLLDGLASTRQRADRALYHADQVGSQLSGILAQNRSDIDRSVANVRDATAYGRLLTQKIFANPFLISPLYKPTREDVRAQASFDVMQEFVAGARELNDAITKMNALRGQETTPQEKQALEALLKRCFEINSRMKTTIDQMALDLQQEGARGVRR